MSNYLSHSANLCLSLATFPVLVGLFAVNALAQGLQDVGEASEEIFRGDRLPILNFPDTETESND